MGRTVGELLDSLTLTEYLGWVDYFADEADNQGRRQARARGEVRTDDPNAAAQLLASIGKAPATHDKAPRRRKRE